jgi:hypothetical protein
MVTPLDGYDVLLWLRWAAVPRAPEALDAATWLPAGEYDAVRFKNLRAARATHMPIVAFDPVADYLVALRVRTSHTHTHTQAYTQAYTQA